VTADKTDLGKFTTTQLAGLTKTQISGPTEDELVTLKKEFHSVPESLVKEGVNLYVCYTGQKKEPFGFSFKTVHGNFVMQNCCEPKTTQQALDLMRFIKYNDPGGVLETAWATFWRELTP